MKVELVGSTEWLDRIVWQPNNLLPPLVYLSELVPYVEQHDSASVFAESTCVDLNHEANGRILSGALECSTLDKLIWDQDSEVANLGQLLGKYAHDL